MHPLQYNSDLPGSPERGSVSDDVERTILSHSSIVCSESAKRNKFQVDFVFQLARLLTQFYTKQNLKHLLFSTNADADTEASNDACEVHLKKVELYISLKK